MPHAGLFSPPKFFLHSFFCLPSFFFEEAICYIRRADLFIHRRFSAEYYSEIKVF